MFDIDPKAETLTEEQIKRIVSYMDEAEHIQDIGKLIELDFQGFKMVKTVSNPCAFGKGIEILDLKLDVFGPKEDVYYSTFPFLIQNIRRGNTIIKLDDGEGLPEYTIARKGMMKFFDLRLPFVSKEERRCLEFPKYKEDLQLEKNYILAPVLKAIAEGDEVEVFKTLKANGENVQVSYSRETESWVIASKNVGMLVKDRNQIEKYSEGEMSNRYAFASEMAHVWFTKLASMTADARKELTKALSGRTLVGEYIGSQEHQHLVKYSRVSIIFYAVVDNHARESCWPCERAWALFAKYDLDRVHIDSLGTFKNYDQLCDQMEKTFKDVAKSPIAQDEEGNVLYFVRKSANGHQKVLSLAKLKTLEYRLFRKMREKLRGFFCAEKGETAQNKPFTKFEAIVKKFVNEGTDLLEDGKNELPQPFENYVNVFKSAYDFIQENPEQVKVLREEYVTFSENLLNFINKKKDKDGEGQENTANFFYSDILNK